MKYPKIFLYFCSFVRVSFKHHHAVFKFDDFFEGFRAYQSTPEVYEKEEILRALVKPASTFEACMRIELEAYRNMTKRRAIKKALNYAQNLK